MEMLESWPGPSFVVVLLIFPISVYVYLHWFARKDSDWNGRRFHLAIPEQAQPHWKGKRIDAMSINDANDATLIRCLCPATGQLLDTVNADSAREIDCRIAKAKVAQLTWARSSFRDRRRVLRTILRYIIDNQLDICRVACRDTGKTLLDASLGEVMVTLEKIKWILKHGEDSLKPSKRPGSTNPLLFFKAGEVRYQPLGVVCAMVSWNYPLHNLMGPVVASLFAGNAVIVKCSEQVVWSSKFFVQIARRALELHGFDPELVQLVCCWPNVADHLTSHPDIKHITFIGSRPVAHQVARAASATLTPLVLELGGKDPLIVFDDLSASKIREVASIILRGTFQSAGQNCIGVERVIALPKAYSQLEAILGQRVAELTLGSSIDEVGNVDMGAMIAVHHLERLEALVSDSINQGAELVAGGHRFTHPKYPLGVYFEPTMLKNVTKDMRIAQEEVFGPVLLLMRSESIDDAIDIANSVEYALGCSVFGSKKADLNRVANEVNSGNVAVNDFATYHMCQLPFGGVYGSGYGKFGGKEGLRSLCIEKSVCYDRFPFISTFIPRALDYPIPSASKAWTLVSSMNILGYSPVFWGKVNALRRIIRT